MQNKETKERNLYSDLQRRMLGKDVKQRMENKMQDSKREELWERLAPVVLEREEWFGNITVGGATDQQGKDNLLDFIASEISKAREEGKREAFTKDEWFMLKLAMNDIFNKGNRAYEGISEKIRSYLI